MAAAARRKIVITYSGDVEGEEIINAANNASSPALISSAVLPHEVFNVSEVWELQPYAVDVPAGATAVTILKPSDNLAAILLAVNNIADAADGFAMHPTDPDTISISGQTSFYLVNTSHTADVTLRLFWS